MSDHNLCAVVITYYPDSKIYIRIQRLLSQFAKIIIVDNGSGGSGFGKTLSLYENNKQIHFIKNSKNLGIAKALNQGVLHAMKAGFEWIALFDQDSFLDKDAIDGLKYTIKAHPDIRNIMIIGCNLVPPNSKVGLIKESYNSSLWKETDQVITSGSVISAKAFETVGRYIEPLFIDYVDIEYSLRVKNHGYKIIVALNAHLYHEVGNQSDKKLFNRRIHPTQHPPLRRYYQFRNSILLFKMYYNKNPEWIKKNAIVLLKMLTTIILFEKNKFSKMLYIAKGIYHGIQNRAGKVGERRFMPDTIDLSPRSCIK